MDSFVFFDPVLWLLAVAAVGTSALSAVLGMAGGSMLLGAMAFVLPVHLVVPLHGIVQAVSNGSRVALLPRSVHRGIVAWFAVPALFGVVVGACLTFGNSPAWFRPAVGVFLLSNLLLDATRPRLRDLPIWCFAPLGLAVGLLASTLGATGPLLAPFFLRDDLVKEEVVATKAALQMIVHTAKLPAFFALGFDYWQTAPYAVVLCLAAFGGTILGRSVLIRLPARLFDVLYRVLMTVLGLSLLLRG